jgi:transcription elongation factor
MTNELLELLAKTTGIIRTSNGILSKKIDPAEYPDLLCMKTIKFDVTVGQWIKIKTGNYKGDFGRVMELHAWGVNVYLVPRKTYRNNENTRKRKASKLVPDPELFFPQFSANNIYYPDGSIKSGQHIFAHGLTIKTFDYHSIDLQVSEISLKLYDLFLKSKHPDIPLSSLPRPREWIFTEGDNVTVHPFNKKGSITSIEASYAEVEVYREGLHCEPWHKIKKFFTIGDFVRITGGPNLDSNGWMIDINRDIATIASKIMEGEIKYDFASAINVSSCKSILFYSDNFFARPSMFT